MIDWFGLVRPAIHVLDPETAHRFTIQALKLGLAPASRAAPDPILAQRLWGLEFASPVGLAAGFDKNAEVPDAMLRLGFGFAEIGTVTPRPQAGNPHPRLFRLAEDEAVVNRMGFNNEGIDAAARRLSRRRRNGIVGVNVGKNKDTVDAADDYVRGVEALARYADYVVCNVSSPNTPGLRDLQARAALGDLVDRVQAALARSVSGRPPPLLVKVAPDLSEHEREDIAAVALERRIAGLIVGNTTISRPEGLRSRHRGEAGGLSGRPLFEPSTHMLREFYRLTGGRVTLVGVGGVTSGSDAYAKIRAGASLVQLYTALVFRGPGLAAAIARELAGLLRADGFAGIAEAVGAEHR